MTPLKDAYDYEHLMADPLYPTSTKNKDKIKKIDMKTMELKRMEGLEDMANFFQAEADGSPTKEVDEQLLQIMRKLDFRSRDFKQVFQHRKSQQTLEVSLVVLV